MQRILTSHNAYENQFFNRIFYSVCTVKETIPNIVITFFLLHLNSIKIFLSHLHNSILLLCVQSILIVHIQLHR